MKKFFIILLIVGFVLPFLVFDNGSDVPDSDRLEFIVYEGGNSLGWYTIWNSGIVEQGGNTAPANLGAGSSRNEIITLPLAMPTPMYQISFTFFVGSNVADVTGVVLSNTRSPTGFTVRIKNTASSTTAQGVYLMWTIFYRGYEL